MQHFFLKPVMKLNVGKGKYFETFVDIVLVHYDLMVASVSIHDTRAWPAVTSTN